MPSWGRTIRTLKHLRLGQIAGQVRSRWRKRTRDPAKVLTGVTDDWRLGKTSASLPLRAPVPDQSAPDLREGNFTFLGHRVPFGNSIDWTAPGQTRLWTYNLHYFDWLWTLLPVKTPDWETARRLTLDWIDRHPPARDACGWEPYPLSLRILNWSLLYGRRHDSLLREDPEFRTRLESALSPQVRWLEQNLETHIQANHLLENLAALATVASIFQSNDSCRLLARILPRLKRELAEQILPDGMHYERAPMYHLRVLWLVETLAMVGDSGVKAAVDGLPERMRKALSFLRHPDGDIALLNDSALGIYLDSWKGQDRAPVGAWELPLAGFQGIREEVDGGRYFVCKTGRIGPDHQPGHAHADIGTFELSLFGQRVITDTGVANYTESEARHYARSTRAHNTVEIAGQDQAEMWGVFRVGRRPKDVRSTWKPGPNGFRLEVTHDGYAHLPCRARHTRIWEWDSAGRRLAIEDRIHSPATLPSRSVAFFHLHPCCEARVSPSPDGPAVMVEWRGGRTRMRIFSPATGSPPSVFLRKTRYWSTFDAEETRTTIAVEFDDLLRTEFLF